MPLNSDLIQARFEDIQHSVVRLRKIRELSQEQFLADRDTLDIACYRLLVAIEAALQICFHVSAKQLQRVPESYADCFALIGEAGIISEDLARDLRRMAGFRNMLVHVYWDVDYGLVYEVVQDSLEDLLAFVRAVGGLL